MNEYKPSWNIGWVDFSEVDKGKVMQVLSMLSEKGTVDELGIGVVRDSLSDKMFSGITTIQTRAKYFFIIPNILLSYQQRRKRGQSARDYLYEEETRIMNELAARYNYSGNNQIIGETIAAQNKDLQPRKWRQVVRKPSAIYWNGLRQFGLIQSELSLANFLNLLERTLDNAIDTYDGGDGSADDRDFERELLKLIHIPQYSKIWDEDLEIELTSSEADFLRHYIIDKQEGSLLALVLEDLENANKFLLCDSFNDLTVLDFIRADNEVNKVVQTAHDFSFLMEGAHIRYNIQLQEMYGHDKRKDAFETSWLDWFERLEQFRWESFDREFLWELTFARSIVKPFTKSFIDEWIDGVRKGKNINELDSLVYGQERQNKKDRAKLRSNNETRYDDWVGISSLSYRFGNVKTIVSDIVKGLKLEDA